MTGMVLKIEKDDTSQYQKEQEMMIMMIMLMMMIIINIVQFFLNKNFISNVTRN